MAQRSAKARLLDMLDAIEGARAAVAGRSLEAFAADWIARRAVERAIEIISEASRHLPEELKAEEHGVPWRQIAGIGNILRHDYARVADDVTYAIATRELDVIEAMVRRRLEKFSKDA